MPCLHKSCSYEDRIWLPIRDDLSSDAVLHPWCINCGLIKNISDDRSRKIGYWMNILSKISNRFSITQCQKRLIANEITASNEFGDTYGITGFSQKEMFIKIIKKYCNINHNTIDAFIC